eukprot:6055225-Prymnesium_polylepis.1
MLTRLLLKRLQALTERESPHTPQCADADRNYVTHREPWRFLSRQRRAQNETFMRDRQAAVRCADRATR